jgi:signal transduction histidine kinase
VNSLGASLLETRMFFIGKKISRRFFGGLLLVAVIPISLMGYGIYRVAQNVVIHFAFMHIETIRDAQENHLNTWFGERVKDLEVIAQLPFVQELCAASCCMGSAPALDAERSGLVQDILAITRAKSPSYKSMHIFSPSGAMLASTAPHSEEILNFDPNVLFAEVEKTGRPALSPVHQHSDQRWYMHLAAPIRAKDGRIVAYALAVLDVSATLDPIMTDRAGLGRTGETYLVSKDRRIITESRYLSRPETLDRFLFTHGVDAAIEGKKGTSIYTNYMGHKVIGSYAWLPRYNWAVLVEMEENEILAPLKTVQTAVVLTTAVVGILSLFLAWFMSRRVSRPIVRVAEASREIAEGRLDQRIPFTGSDEVAVLSENFNVMAEKLSTVITSLQEKEASLQKAYEELLEMQQQLVQSEKMAAIGELVASVVHEMRNPLCSVKLNLQIIGRSLEQGSLLSEHYLIAIDQVSQLEKMFTDLMNYSKPLDLQKESVSIERLIDESLRQLEPIVKGLDVIIAQKLQSPLPSILADPDKMRQVFVNIIKNAVESTGKEGKVEITGSVEDTNGKVLVTLDIADNGTGISQHDLKRIFQPFFTTKRKGTGLGLPIVKKILEAHGYTISVWSQEAKGTAVHLQMRGEESE